MEKKELLCPHCHLPIPDIEAMVLSRHQSRIGKLKTPEQIDTLRERMTLLNKKRTREDRIASAAKVPAEVRRERARKAGLASQAKRKVSQ